MKFSIIYLVSFFLVNIAWAQVSISGHSHNDYVQKHPLKTAFEARMGSIEADVFLVDNNLYVAHEAKEINPTFTLVDLYLKPLTELVQTGKAYPLIILIDIKTHADSTLDEVVQQIARYPVVLGENCPVKFVISGNRPNPTKWASYPPFIQFDGRPHEIYTPQQWQRVGMVSDSFNNFISEKGQKTINQETFNKMKAVADTIHTQGKKVRFWATPDTQKVWKALAKMGVDFINTDTPKALRGFLNKK